MFNIEISGNYPNNDTLLEENQSCLPSLSTQFDALESIYGSKRLEQDILVAQVYQSQQKDLLEWNQSGQIPSMPTYDLFLPNSVSLQQIQVERP
jgi:hypothetical protein